jgi:hypothetical protein
MTRVFVGMAATLMVTFLPTMIAAQPITEPTVTVARRDGQVTITAKAQPLVISQALTTSAFDLTVSDGRDTAQISGDVQGHVRIVRAGRRVAVSLATATPADAASTRAVLAGSSALKAFDRLMATAWARSSKDALIFASAHAIVGLLQGDVAPLRAVVGRLQREVGPRLVRAAQTTASWCWRAYERDVVNYTYELEECIRAASESFNPISSAWCGYSYNLKASLAFIWLLDCSGLS